MEKTRKSVPRGLTYLFIAILSMVAFVWQPGANWVEAGVYVERIEFKPLARRTAENLSYIQEGIRASAKLQKLISEALLKVADEDREYLLKKMSSLESQLREEFEQEILQYVKPLKVRVKIGNPGRELLSVESLKVLYFGRAEDPDGPIDKTTGENVTKKVQFSHAPPFKIGPEERVYVLMTLPANSRSFIMTQIESTDGLSHRARMGQYRLRAVFSSGEEISDDFSLEASFVDGRVEETN